MPDVWHSPQQLSTKELLRCLKRYIVRELYPLILSDLAHANRPLLTEDRQQPNGEVLP